MSNSASIRTARLGKNTINNVYRSSSYSITGPKGDQGPEGKQGNSGAQGNSGLIGAQGPTGTKGVQGVQGLQGVQGDQGPAADETQIKNISSDTDVNIISGKNVNIIADENVNIITGGDVVFQDNNENDALINKIEIDASGQMISFKKNLNYDVSNEEIDVNNSVFSTRSAHFISHDPKEQTFRVGKRGYLTKIITFYNNDSHLNFTNLTISSGNIYNPSEIIRTSQFTKYDNGVAKFEPPFLVEVDEDYTFRIEDAHGIIQHMGVDTNTFGKDADGNIIKFDTYITPSIPINAKISINSDDETELFGSAGLRLTTNYDVNILAIDNVILSAGGNILCNKYPVQDMGVATKGYVDNKIISEIQKIPFYLIIVASDETTDIQSIGTIMTIHSPAKFLLTGIAFGTTAVGGENFKVNLSSGNQNIGVISIVTLGIELYKEDEGKAIVILKKDTLIVGVSDTGNGKAKGLKCYLFGTYY